MKNLLSIAAVLLCFATGTAQAQSQPPQQSYYNPNEQISWEYARLITLESIIAGGIGRSRMFVVTPDGKKLEDDLENYYSLAGINFKNVYKNEEKKTKMLNMLSDEGWDLYWIETGNQDGIYTTKYLLRRRK